MTAGDFTVAARFKTAFKTNAIFYGVAGVVGLAALIYYGISKEQTLSAMYSLTIALSQFWGLLVAMVLLGHGLAELPKSLWTASDLQGELQAAYGSAVTMDEDMRVASVEFNRVLHKLKWADENCDPASANRAHLQAIIATVSPLRYRKANASRADWDEDSISRPEFVTDSVLVYINALVKAAKSAMEREDRVWESFLARTLELEDSLLHGGRGGSHPTVWDGMSHWWIIWGRPQLLKIAAGITVALSIMTIWTEATFWISSVNLSPWSLALQVSSLPLRLVLVLIPVSYLCVCAYYSLFRVRIFSYYRLVANPANDANSLLFSGAYLSRLGVPLAYNYLLASGITGTAYSKVVGVIDIAPVIGEHFQTYFPILLVALCIASMLDLYSRFAAMLGFERFETRGFADEHDILAGKRILAKARTLYEKRRASLKDDPTRDSETVSLLVAPGWDSSSSTATDTTPRGSRGQPAEEDGPVFADLSSPRRANDYRAEESRREAALGRRLTLTERMALRKEMRRKARGK